MHLKTTVILLCCITAGVASPSVCDADYQLTFTLDHSANMSVDGVCFGRDLQEQYPSSGHTMLGGSIEAIVTFGSGNEPSSIRFIDADISFYNWVDDELVPGIGAAAGTADANFGLSNAAETFSLALRNMAFDVASDQPITLSGSQILQEDIDYTISQGMFEYQDGINGSSEDFSGRTLAHDGSSGGVLVKIYNRLELVLPCRLVVDTSDITGVEGDYLRFNGHANATAVVPEPCSLTLLLFGGLSLIVLRRGRRLKQGRENTGKRHTPLARVSG